MTTQIYRCGCVGVFHIRITSLPVFTDMLGLSCDSTHLWELVFVLSHTHTYTHFPTPCRDIFPHLTTGNFSWLFCSLHVNVVLEQDAEPQIAPDVKIVSGFGQKERNKMVV